MAPRRQTRAKTASQAPATPPPVEPQVNDEEHDKKMSAWVREIDDLTTDLPDQVEYLDVFAKVLSAEPYIEKREELLPVLKQIIIGQKRLRDARSVPKQAPKNGVKKSAAKKATVTRKRATKAKGDEGPCIALSVGEWQELYKKHHEAGPCSTCEDVDAGRGDYLEIMLDKIDEIGKDLRYPGSLLD